MPRRSRTKTQPTLTPLDERAVPAVIEGVEINSETNSESTDDSVNVIMTTSASNETITLTPHTTTVLDDGKVLVAGTVNGTFKGVEGAQETLLGVVRLLADGKIDSSFNDGQIQTLAAGSKQAATVRQVLTDSAGRVTLFGTTYDVPNIPGPQSRDVVIARLGSDGGIDTSFGTNGVSVISLDPTTNEIDQQIAAAAIMNDGRVVVLGTRKAVTNTSGLVGSEFVLARLTNTGALDTTFGSQGRTIVNVDRGGVTSQVIASDVVVAPDGRITLAGSWTANGAVSPDASDNNTFVLARLTSAGNVDVTFDGDGRQYLRGPIVVGADGSGLDMDRLPDGRLVLAGTLGTNSSIGDGVIIRLNADGSTDTSLDGDGVLMLPPTAGTLERPFAVETDSAGRITVAIAQGSLGVVSTNNATLIRRFNSSGTVDNTFQTNTQKVSGTAYTTDLSLTDDGSILLTNSAGVTAVSADGKTSGTFYSPPTVPPTSPPTGSPISPPPIQAPNAKNLPSGLGTATADMTGDGIADVVQVVNTNQLRVIDGKSGKTIIDNHQPFENRYKGGIQVASGDFDRDGKSEVVVSPNDGGSGRVIVMQTVSTTSKSGTNWAFNNTASFFGINDENFRGGASVAAGDFNGDGFADLAVGAGNTGGPRLAMYDGKTIAASPTRLVGDFFALPDESFRGGINLAAIDTNNDGFAELAVGAGIGGAPRVRVFDSRRLLANAEDAVVSDTIVGNASSRGGVMLGQRFATKTDTKGGFSAYVGQTRFAPLLSRSIFTGFDTTGVNVDVTVPAMPASSESETENETETEPETEV